MEIPFTKMHGLGNDFMVVRWPLGVPEPSAERVRAWANRRHGVGFDQLLLVTEAPDAEADAAYRIFNADGGEVEQCGNGVRCIASLLGHESGTRLTLLSDGGLIEAELLGGGWVRVSYGEPNFDPDALPLLVPQAQDRYQLELTSGPVELGAVSVGNPHAVLLVDSVDDAPVGILGAELATHPAFPRGVNVGFMQVQSETSVRLRVYERGVGETEACGTGAAAAAAVGRRWGILAEEVDVKLPGGTLTMRWPGPGTPLWQTGPTSTVFEGRIKL